MQKRNTFIIAIAIVILAWLLSLAYLDAMRLSHKCPCWKDKSLSSQHIISLAQQRVVTSFSDGCWTTPMRCERLKNGECPVCGTMAEDFRLQGTQYHPTIFLNEKTDDKGKSKWERIVRCAKCNAAFWQDGN